MGHDSLTAVARHHPEPSSAHAVKMADSDESEAGGSALKLLRAKARPKSVLPKPAKRKARPLTDTDAQNDSPTDAVHTSNNVIEDPPPKDATDGNREKKAIVKDTTTATVTANANATATATVLAGSMDEYREGCLRLEKLRHSRMYEAEKRRLYSERTIESTYESQVRAAEEDFEAGRRALVTRLLQDNMEKTRRVEELRYKIVREEPTNSWTRRHEMSLRGRATGNGEDLQDPGYIGRSSLRHLGDDDVGADHEREKPQRRRKNDNKNSQQPKVKLHLALDEGDVLHDLAEITGEKRVREPDPHQERRVKKRK